MKSYVNPDIKSAVVTSVDKPPIHAPIIPIIILIITKNGKDKTEAVIFGNIKKDAEFNPIIYNASICAVTRILPISEAILDPTFPARIKEIIVGENSNIKESLLANPTR
mgnify:CR=1 FL=1